jgi:hypothetical protein
MLVVRRARPLWGGGGFCTLCKSILSKTINNTRNKASWNYIKKHAVGRGSLMCSGDARPSTQPAFTHAAWSTYCDLERQPFWTKHCPI